MDADSQRVLDLLREQQSVMTGQLHQFCDINSGTDNLEGLAHMHQVLSSAFTPIADALEAISFSPLSVSIHL